MTGGFEELGEEEQLSGEVYRLLDSVLVGSEDRRIPINGWDAVISRALDDYSSFRLVFETANKKSKVDSLAQEYLVSEESVYKFNEDSTRPDELDAVDIQVLRDELVEILGPLVHHIEQITDRREGLRRVIGPLVIAASLSGLDKLNESLATESEVYLKELEKKPYAHLALEWFKPERKFATCAEASFGLAAMLGGFDIKEVSRINRIIESMDTRLNPTEGQQKIFDKFTYDEILTAILINTTEAQAQITATIALPAYLAAKYGCTEREQLLGVLNTVSLDEIKEILSDEKFAESLTTMSHAPNATFMDIVHFDNIKLELDEEEERTFTPGVERIELITEKMEALARRNKDPDIDKVLYFFDSYNLFVKQDNGEVVLNPEFVKSSRLALRLDSAYEINDDGLTPTQGCPATLRAVRIGENDLTKDQREAMTSGKLGISLDEDGTMLHFERNPIRELHKLHVASFDAFISYYQQKH